MLLAEWQCKHFLQSPRKQVGIAHNGMKHDTLAPMRNDLQLRQAMLHQTNVTAFCRRHKLPQRTIWRFIAGGKIRLGTALLLSNALDVERGVKS